MGVKLAEAKIKNVSLKVEEGAEDKLQFTIEYGRENFDGLAILAKSIKGMMGRKTVFSLELLQQELEFGEEQSEQMELHLPLREGEIEGVEGVNWADPIDLEGLDAVLVTQGMSIDSRADGNNGHSALVVRRDEDDKTALVSLEEFNKPESERWSWAILMRQIEKQFVIGKTVPGREGFIEGFTSAGVPGGAKWEDKTWAEEWMMFLESQGYEVQQFHADSRVAKIAKDEKVAKVSVEAAYREGENRITWAQFLADIEQQIELLANAEVALEKLPVAGEEPTEEVA
jgi:hypothetical protein